MKITVGLLERNYISLLCNNVTNIFAIPSAQATAEVRVS